MIAGLEKASSWGKSVGVFVVTASGPIPRCFAVFAGEGRRTGHSKGRSFPLLTAEYGVCLSRVVPALYNLGTSGPREYLKPRKHAYLKAMQWKLVIGKPNNSA